MSSSKSKIFETTSFLANLIHLILKKCMKNFENPNLVPDSWQQYFEGIDDGKNLKIKKQEFLGNQKK